jgi:hypothetical protein
MCACPASLGPLIVCGTRLNPVGLPQQPLSLTLNARSRVVTGPPRQSAIPPPALSKKIMILDEAAVIVTMHCQRAPTVTVKPASAARTLVVARGTNGGIAGITLAVVSNTTVVLRAYRGHRLVGRVTVYSPPAPPAPPPSPPPAPPARNPCHPPGPPGTAQPQYCITGTAPPVSAD